MRRLATNFQYKVSDNNDLQSENTINQQINEFGLQIQISFIVQHPIDIYIADFYCHEKNLVIELDGEIHNSLQAQEKDKSRTFDLENKGLKVIRFKNIEVENDIERVLEDLKSASFFVSGCR